MSTATYVVRRGDTIDLIARVFGTTVEAIINANGLSNPNVLFVGQTLVIPLPAVSTPFVASPYWSPYPGGYATYSPTTSPLPPTEVSIASHSGEADDKRHGRYDDRGDKGHDKHRDKRRDRHHDRHHGDDEQCDDDRARRDQEETAGEQYDAPRFGREDLPQQFEEIPFPAAPDPIGTTSQIPEEYPRFEASPATGLVPRLPQIEDVLVVGIPFRNTSIRIADGLLFVLNADKSEYRAGETVTVRLMKFNIGPVPLILRYRSSQLSEFVASRDGIEVFRASAGRVFTPALQEVILSPGEAQSFTESFVPETVGVYRISAWNLAVPRLRMSLDVRVEGAPTV